MLNPDLFARIDDLARSFADAHPFRHVTIDGFFAPEVAERLLAGFPPFDETRAVNEFGRPTGKWTVPDLRSIGPDYAALYDHLLSRDFLAVMERISGIPELLGDPHFYGGGTHENRHGQDLDPHVDFNYDIGRRLHRRINVIVYMNPEWDLGWGGALELHSDPRDPDTNQVTTILPAFNRAVMFETNEHSWHGFQRISLPEDRRHLSRKSISIYLYSRTRPADEVAPEHGTFYVQRPLPPHLRPGHTLTAEDVATVQELVRRRDHWIFHYQQRELATGRVPETVGQADPGRTRVALEQGVDWLRRNMPLKALLRPAVHWYFRRKAAGRRR